MPRRRATSPDIGLWIALAGASLWALGAGLLAKEPEGDPEPTPDVVDLTAHEGRDRTGLEGRDGHRTATSADDRTVATVTDRR